MSRYESKAKGVNRGKFYEEFLQERNIKRLTQYRTPKFPVLNTKVRSRFSVVFHSWKLGDSYWKLAGQYYGNGGQLPGITKNRQKVICQPEIRFLFQIQ